MATTKLTVLSNGSLRVEGTDFELVDAQGQPYGLAGRERISICRCGLSSQKPFCDGSHKGHFEHAAVAFDLPAPKAATPPVVPPAAPDASAAPLA
ncbi:CDGSH iron-sulfur domain-containing protein [Hymenobacter puniceus]|uniref:CDGSH iron-sulfur domain-containing protein n=1 Tax=Hymenobacter sp. BT190 TaxID=2763505 RepID=UPI0016514DA6|nr:CDGSH iron-sulfur domain-containing protein [Hymenobacter sp. BT190]MBC6697924.1 CDGSH iron-sulfur domain-containing protein [Hymenobacter sp. BT190]